MVNSNEIVILCPALPISQEINLREGSPQPNVIIKITNCEPSRLSYTYCMSKRIHDRPLCAPSSHVTLKVI